MSLTSLYTLFFASYVRWPRFMPVVRDTPRRHWTVNGWDETDSDGGRRVDKLVQSEGSGTRGISFYRS